MVEVNPANGIKRLTSGNGEGFHTREVSQIVQCEKRHARGTMARMALAIFMFTGLRLSDAAIFGRQHIAQVRNKDTGTWEKRIRIKPGKTDKSKVRKEAIVVELPLLPELEDELSFAPAGNLTFLVTEYGRPFSKTALVTRCANGGTKRGSRAAAPTGSARQAPPLPQKTVPRMNSRRRFYGWTTYQQPDHYIRKARRRIVVQSAGRFWYSIERKTKMSHFGGGGRKWDKKVQKTRSNQRQRKPMVGPEDVSKSLISLVFSWVEIRSSPVLFRMIPRPRQKASLAMEIQ
ncbi:hypothetical protein [Mesorhizobium sp. CO1-1-8]|uniref:hypothetical protein n=1 Tax=Mesorhizobium sp. CO1-1-8 TaxID=2876631 RepID=UPI001CD06EF0|nr:hypothetical protein [Mesorhizobium sp. CO1-1-8]MBZ9775820.1 hypothetical protein [Mesorhizobium sp. CO1-1-8]